MTDGRPTHLDLFSGIGGFALAARWAGFRTIGFCEIDKYCRKVLAKNFGCVPLVPSIEELICALQNNKKLVAEVSKRFSLTELPEESKSTVFGAEGQNHYHRVSPTVVGNIAHGLVESQRCAEQRELIPVEENGYAENAIQTGKTEKDWNANQSEMLRSNRNGEGVSLPVTGTDVKTADCRPKRRVNSTRTISRNGAIFQTYDLKYLMDELYANLATTGYTVDLLTAGVPCQPASCAGKQRGASDDRWLWPETIEVARLLRPRWLLFENVYGLVALNDGLELDQVLSDLEALGYATRPFAIPACAVDAPHRRNRVWIVGYADNPVGITQSQGSIGHERRRTGNTGGSTDVANAGYGSGRSRGIQRHGEDSQSMGERTPDHSEQSSQDVADTNGTGSQGHGRLRERGGEWATRPCRWPDEGEWFAQSGMGRVAHGIPSTLDIAGIMDYIFANGSEREVEMAKAITADGKTNKVRALRLYLEVAETSLGLAATDVCNHSLSDLPHEGRHSEREVGKREPKETTLRSLQEMVSPERFPPSRNLRSKELPLNPREVQRWLAVGQRVDRLKGLGNAIVPQVAYQILKPIYNLLENYRP